MSLQLLKASTSDALSLNGISKRAFDSDILVGAASAGGPPGYMSLQFHTKMARQGHLYKLTDDGLIVGGAILFLKNDFCDQLGIYPYICLLQEWEHFPMHNSSFNDRCLFYVWG